MVSLFSTNNSYGQCIQTFEFGSASLSAVVNGSDTIECHWGGDYGTWNSAVTGNTYTFSSTTATDFLTISAVPGGPALAWGTQPLVYTSTVTGTLYVHVSTNSGCGAENSCRNITGTTTALPNTGCTNGTPYSSGFLSTIVSGSSTIFCSFAGGYGTWYGAITGNAYTFTSTITTDYLTIRTGTPDGLIVASGTQPLSWISNTTGTIYVHVNTNSACGIEGSCRNIKGTTIVFPLCVASPITPTNGSTISPCGVTLSWPFVASAESYDVYLNTGAGPATTLVASSQTGTSYSTGLLAGSTSYSWRVVPKNGLGAAVSCSDFTFTTTAVPAAPTGLACYQTAIFNQTTCVWEVTGTQPISPSITNINVTVSGDCQSFSGEWVNSGLLNGYYYFEFDISYPKIIFFDGVQWVIKNIYPDPEFVYIYFTNSSPSNGLYPPTTGWIAVHQVCLGGTLTYENLLPYTTSTILTEGFDNITSLPAAGWSQVNASWYIGITPNWYQGDGIDIPSHTGAATSCILVDHNSTVGPISLIDNWLITPQMTLNNGDVIKFWTTTTSAIFSKENLEVRLSTSGAGTDPSVGNLGSYTTLLLALNPDLIEGVYPQGWSQYTIPVTGLSGPTNSKIAFRYNGPYVEDSKIINPNLIALDTFSVKRPNYFLACNESYEFNNTTCVWDLVTGGPCSIVNLKLFIEGYYTGSSTMASVKLNQWLGWEPQYAPAADIVGDIIVELHDTAAPYSVLHTTTATLKTDGTAVCTFRNEPSGSFYIAVKTSNAVETWTALPQIVGPTPLLYDFTTAISQAYEDNMKSLAGGVFGFFSGDINQDDVIDGSDATVLDLHIYYSFTGGYATDLNGDGSVDGSDAIYYENNQYNSVFAHSPQ